MKTKRTQLELEREWRVQSITVIANAICGLVEMAYFERHDNPQKFKLRNHHISQALGHLASLHALNAYPWQTIVDLEHAIDNYDIFMVNTIIRHAQIQSYNDYIREVDNHDNT